MKTKTLAGTIAAAFISLAGTVMAIGATLDQPSGKPILTIAGNIGATNGSGVARFDREMLERMGLETIETTTPWHNGVVKFEGVSLAKLMQHVEAKGDRAVAVALNDYKSEIPLDDFSRFNVILALKRNGEYMPVRDKGPLFIVYPYDAHSELKSQKYYSRSAWQVTRIEIK